VADLPECLEPARHRDLRGRQTEVWVRRTVVALLAAIIVLALANLFGQRPSDESAAAPGASLTVHAPARLRDGLLFQARFTIVATQQIGQPTLVLDPGWFDRITLNTVVPEPKTEVSSNRRVELTYDPLAPGRRMVVVLSMQINPPGGGFRDQGVDLRDGDRLLVRIPRTVTVFP
jgi:hypothetical protein